jgi:hypothetical protein
MRWLVESPQDSDIVKVRYHPVSGTSGCAVVEGRLADAGTEASRVRSYPVVLDTGAPGAVFVNRVHVRENRLHVRPAAPGESLPAACRLPSVRIGEMVLQDPACWYLPPRAESASPATSQAGDRSIILGLPALRGLSYLLLDGVSEEAEFSAGRPFGPARPQEWSQYPFTIQEDAYGYPSLFVELAIGGGSRTRTAGSHDTGQHATFQLDTGSAKGLTVTERLWERLSRECPPVELRAGAELYPYIGRLRCRYGYLRDLRVGDQILDRSRLSVFADDSVLMTTCEALIGMGCFRDTTLVLDFRRGILWVRKLNPGESRPGESSLKPPLERAESMASPQWPAKRSGRTASITEAKGPRTARVLPQ